MSPMPLSDAGAFNALLMSRLDGCDGLRLARPALVPEVHLHLAEDAIVLQARLEAQTGRRLAAPFWANAWVGGQAVARYVLEDPEAWPFVGVAIVIVGLAAIGYGGWITTSPDAQSILKI